MSENRPTYTPVDVTQLQLKQLQHLKKVNVN